MKKISLMLIFLLFLVILITGCSQKILEKEAIGEEIVEKEVHQQKENYSTVHPSPVSGTVNEVEKEVEEDINYLDETEEKLVKETQEQQQTQTNNLVEGKTLSERLDILKTDLHTDGSGDEAKKYFPDFESVYVDDGSHNPYFPSMILPFTYYYSKEADITVSICNIKFTVFICSGKIEELLKEADYDNCQIAKEYFSPEKYG